MTLFKLSFILLAIVISLACPPLAIPLGALVWIMIDKMRDKARREASLRVAIATDIAERERYRALRSI